MHIRQLLWKMLSGTLTGLRLRASDKEIIKLEKFVITGGKPLHGEVTISGAKNAAVGVLPATILAADVCVIENLPDISDVAVSLKILSVLGAQIKMINRNTYEIDTTHLTGTNVPDDLSRQMRASYYFLGALLSRFGKAQVAMPGGCNLGPRPIDQHLKVFIAELEKAVTGYEQSQKSAEKFIALIDKYENFDTLTNTMLNEFVEKILVHERARKGSQDTTQEIEIYFNFLGRYIPPSLQPVPLTPEEQEELRKKEERKDRLHQNYLKRKASGAQKRYEDKIKAKKKAEMDAKKALIRAEDMKKGVFSTIGQLPKEEPRKGSIAASAAV